MKKINIRKWSGHVLTFGIFLAAVSPSTFHISATVHPWIFLFSIVWIFAYSNGVFWK